jgi:hypothetical protein
MSDISNINSKASRALYIAFKPLEETVKDTTYGVKHNCLVFDPLFDRANYDAMTMYTEFFQNASNIKKIPIITEQSVVELANTLGKKYGAIVNNSFAIGGILAPVHVPRNIVDGLVRDLTMNPMKYFTSEITKIPEKVFSESYF